MTMELRELCPEGHQALEQVLGYLNFSAGAADPQLLYRLNRLYEVLGEPTEVPAWKVVGRLLAEKLADLARHSPVFADSAQAQAALRLVWEHVLPGYLEFHGDLLFHQREAAVFNAFFVGRACEQTLRQGPPWDEHPRIVQAAIAGLNDFIGHRPVPALESQKIEPYAHEWVRPVPLYVRDAGVAVGPYQELLEQALTLLRETDEQLGELAQFHLQRLDELAFDPRAYDFDHPVNKRPNYQFGCWDPHHIDNRGHYRRFVVQQVTLDALLARLEGEPQRRDELLFEAAAVLAGTMLMASGVSGSGPGTYDSNTTLSKLVPVIATYRDEFYQRLIERVEGPHGERLRKEAAELHQPFGSVRQHLNGYLTRRRAAQLKHVHLAKLFARMGYTDAASRQADIVPVASVRLRCRVDCLLTQAHWAVERGELREAARFPQEIVELIRRGIHCGALVDPWNVLGFEAHFSLFPALENSVHDHRVDELIGMVEELFELFSRLWSEAAARDDQGVFDEVERRFRETAEWWRQFAVHEVSSVDAVDPLEAFHSARHVAEALRLWHRAGAGAGDVSFWASHAEMFDTPQAYSLVVDALLSRRDFVASMALLVHWLSSAERVELELPHTSFCDLAERWLTELARADQSQWPASAGTDRWVLARKFLDYVEANAGELWETPEWELAPFGTRGELQEGELAEAEDEEPDEPGLFQAAYEDVVYRDSSEDGFEGDLAELGITDDDELVLEIQRIGMHLAFLQSMARLWTAFAVGAGGSPAAGARADHRAALENWAQQAAGRRRQLGRLLEDVRKHQVPPPTGNHDSLIEYDRRASIKEGLLDQIILTCAEVAAADRWLSAAAAAAGAAPAGAAPAGAEPKSPGGSQRPSRPGVGPPEGQATADGSLGLDERQLTATFAAVLANDAQRVQQLAAGLVDSLRDQPLLYVPLARGGDPQRILAARVRQHCLEDLLYWLPRLGLIVEACQLIETAREMERSNPVGPGAVTEFDELFKTGYRSIVESLVAAAERDARQWSDPKRAPREVEQAEGVLIRCLERITESLLLSWLEHSRTLRLSVLESVTDDANWKKVVEFIGNYGKQIFTQRFFTLGNLRAILHEGVDTWLEQLERDPGELAGWNLLDELDQRISRAQATRWLSLILEAVVENYGEYCDYNITTTQSDSGDQLHTLLDFLRLRVRYDRICWNLRPVVLAHQILVRRGHDEIARVWRRKLRLRIRHEADAFVRQLEQLEHKYGMRLATVADRLSEGFIQPLVVDRMRSLVGPAIDEAHAGEPSPSFELLEREAERLAEKPTGGAIEAPGWLVALDDEVQRKLLPPHEPLRMLPLANGSGPGPHVDFERLLVQLDEWAARQQLRAEDLLQRRAE